MNIEILRQHNAEFDKMSDSIASQIENLHSKGRLMGANSVSILWENILISGSSLPTILIECSEDGKNFSFLKNISIDTLSNTNDITTIIITQLFKYFRFHYTHGGATQGTVSIIINYR
jgi:hypothetical protein